MHPKRCTGWVFLAVDSKTFHKILFAHFVFYTVECHIDIIFQYVDLLPVEYKYIYFKILV